MKKTITVSRIEGSTPEQQGNMLRIRSPEDITIRHDEIKEINIGLEFDFDEKQIILMLVAARTDILLLTPTIILGNSSPKICMHTFSEEATIKKGSLLAYAVPLYVNDIVYNISEIENGQRI